MPLVAHSSLPTFRDLRRLGHTVLTVEEAQHQDIRELHVGLLNMMPDAAFQRDRAAVHAPDRRLEPDRPALRALLHRRRACHATKRPRPTSHDITRMCPRYYAEGLDALIVTGANVANPRLEQEPFYRPLSEVIGWASENVTSVALLVPLDARADEVPPSDRPHAGCPRKKWGVYSHRVVAPRPSVVARNQHALRRAALAVQRDYARAVRGGGPHGSSLKAPKPASTRP